MFLYHTVWLQALAELLKQCAASARHLVWLTSAVRSQSPLQLLASSSMGASLRSHSHVSSERYSC